MSKKYGMTQDGMIYTLYTSREHLYYQKPHLEYPCSADGTKPHRLHTRPFYHQFSQTIDNSEGQFSEHAVHQRNFAHQVQGSE